MIGDLSLLESRTMCVRTLPSSVFRWSLLGLLLACLVACQPVTTPTDDDDDSGDDDASTSEDGDGDGWLAPSDCDDTNPEINPEAREQCDEIDNDCDGEIDNGVAAHWYAATAGDDRGDSAMPPAACAKPSG